MPERRYTDQEVQRILNTAAESEAALTAGSAAEGMTLAEIQHIAAEAGLNASAVSAAAVAVDRAPVPVNRRMLGLPLGVGQTVSLPRDLDDADWRRLVAFLRDTFEAQGQETQVAGRREWRNGNLRVSVESLGDSALLQMRTRKGGAQSLIGTGLSMVLGTGVVAAITALTGADTQAVYWMMPMVFGGGAMAATGAAQLPSWSSKRRAQFEKVADYARQLSSGERPTT